MRTFQDLGSVAPDQPGGPERRRRRGLVMVLLALTAAALVLGAVVGLGGGGEAPAAVAVAPSDAAAGATVTEPAGDQASQDGGEPQGGQDGDGGAGGQDGGGQPPEAKPAELVVTPDPVTLAGVSTAAASRWPTPATRRCSGRPRPSRR